MALVDKRHGSFSDLAGAFTMNTTATSEGGWQGCHMRQEILGSDSADVLAPKEGTLLALLPEELRTVMKPCTKYTDNTGNSMETAAVSRYPGVAVPALGVGVLWGPHHGQ